MGVAGRSASDAAFGGYSNLVVVYASASTVTVTCDWLVLDDGTNSRTVKTVSVTPAITTSGENGLDSGSEASSTWYSVWVIAKADGSSVSGLLSASTASPTMPTNYTLKRRVGWVRNDASSNFMTFYQAGPHSYGAARNIVASGTATTFTTVDVSSSVPPTTSEIYFGTYGINMSGSPELWVRTKSDQSGDGVVLRMNAAVGGLEFTAITGVASQAFQYKVTSSTWDLTVLAYIDNL